MKTDKKEKKFPDFKKKAGKKSKKGSKKKRA